MLYYFKNLFFSFILLSVFSGIANANMFVSPLRFQFDAKNQKYITGFIELNSNNDKEFRYKIYSGYFEVSKDGILQVDFPATHKKFDVKDIYLNPKEISLSPNSKQIVRFTIPNIDKLPDGESRAVIFLEDQKTKSEALPTPNASITASLIVKQRLAIPIYITKGKIIKSGTIEHFGLTNKNQYELDVSSRGNTSIRINGVVQLIQKNKIIKEIKITDVPILPHSQRHFCGELIPINNSKGKIRTKIYYLNSQSRKVILSKEVDFDISKI